MNKKTITIVSVLVGVLLIGIVSAGLVDYFGRVTAEIEAKGPVFYAVSGADPDGDPGSLAINEFPGGGTTYTLSGGNTRYFRTEELDAMDFYAPELKLSVEAYLGAGIEPNSLELEFGYYDTFSQGTETPFCDVIINVISTNSEVYSDTCNGDSADSLEAFYYSIHNMGTSDVKIKVRTSNANTKAEVLGIAP